MSWMSDSLVASLTRLRRNHALEHATVHALTRNLGPVRLVGRSDWSGFWLYGEVPTAGVTQAAQEGWQLLRLGRTEEALHSRCGTNISVALILAFSLGSLSLWVMRRFRFLGGLGFGIAIAAGLAAKQPLGMALQRWFTTEAELDTLHPVRIERVRFHDLTVHHVVTAGD